MSLNQWAAERDAECQPGCEHGWVKGRRRVNDTEGEVVMTWKCFLLVKLLLEHVGKGRSERPTKCCLPSLRALNYTYSVDPETPRSSSAVSRSWTFRFWSLWNSGCQALTCPIEKKEKGEHRQPGCNGHSFIQTVRVKQPQTHPHTHTSLPTHPPTPHTCIRPQNPRHKWADTQMLMKGKENRERNKEEKALSQQERFRSCGICSEMPKLESRRNPRITREDFTKSIRCRKKINTKWKKL